MDRQAKLRELETLRERVARIEAELAAEGPSPWPPRQYYTAYHATTGFMLGMLAALASLLLNVFGALLVGRHPLELIRVYLTFPLGERALDYQMGNDWLVLTMGICLYIGTGALYGIVFQLALTWFTPHSSVGARLALVSVLALAIWVINFYGILAWLQPLLFGGNWIVERVPIVVAAGTHLVFGWTMLLVSPLGRFTPYSPETQSA